MGGSEPNRVEGGGGCRQVPVRRNGCRGHATTPLPVGNDDETKKVGQTEREGVKTANLGQRKGKDHCVTA